MGMGKLFMPNVVGVWSAAQGNSLIIAFSEHTFLNSEELLGYWLMPIAIGVGLGLAGVLKVLKAHR